MLTLRNLVPFLCVTALGAPVVAAEPAAPESAAEPAEASSAAEPADDATDASDPDEEAASPRPAAAEPAGGAAAAAAAPSANEETIYVVQAKPHLMAGRFEIAPQLVQSIGDQFVSHTGLLLSGIYHLKENIAVEVAVGGFAWWDPLGTQPKPRFGGRPADMTLELRKEGLQPLERADLYEYTWIAATDLQFSPLYGKVSFHDIVLGQFNVYVSVGAGVAGLQLESERPDELEKIPGAFGALPPMQVLATLGGGVRFYFTEWLGLRLEVRDYVAPLAVYKSDVPSLETSSSDTLNTLLAQLGVSFIF